VGSWTEVDERIVIGNSGMTDRAARWACEQVGRHGRTVAEVADELGCDWHTANRPVIDYGHALVDDPDRIGPVTVLGLDETAFVRLGPWSWPTNASTTSRASGVVDCAPRATRAGTWPTRDRPRRPSASSTGSPTPTSRTRGSTAR
jgi:hypothetical protein